MRRLRGLYADKYDTHKGRSRHLIPRHCLTPTYRQPPGPFAAYSNRNALFRGRQRAFWATLAALEDERLNAVPRGRERVEQLIPEAGALFWKTPYRHYRGRPRDLSRLNGAGTQ